MSRKKSILSDSNITLVFPLNIFTIGVKLLVMIKQMGSLDDQGDVLFHYFDKSGFMLVFQNVLITGFLKLCVVRSIV